MSLATLAAATAKPRDLHAEMQRIHAEHGIDWDLAHAIADITVALREHGVSCHLTDDFIQ
jgi:hypothetical protein